jgi:hypothetical protein
MQVKPSACQMYDSALHAHHKPSVYVLVRDNTVFRAFTLRARPYLLNNPGVKTRVSEFKPQPTLVRVVCIQNRKSHGKFLPCILDGKLVG